MSETEGGREERAEAREERAEVRDERRADAALDRASRKMIIGWATGAGSIILILLGVIWRMHCTAQDKAFDEQTTATKTVAADVKTLTVHVAALEAQMAILISRKSSAGPAGPVSAATSPAATP